MSKEKKLKEDSGIKLIPIIKFIWKVMKAMPMTTEGHKRRNI